MKYSKKLKVKSTSRTKTRKKVVRKFLEEKPGRGTREKSTKYKYIVERHGQYIVYLLRPARINRGFDFTVNIDLVSFKSKKPKHAEIVKCISETYARCAESERKQIDKALDNTYKCKKLKRKHKKALKKIKFKDITGKEHPILIIFLLLKWLFIEQDITYWNYSGREKLKNKLVERLENEEKNNQVGA